MLTLDESSEVVAPFWSDSWKICPTLAFRVACTLRSASAAFVRYWPFGRVPWSTLTVYSPASSTLTDQRPSPFVVAVCGEAARAGHVDVDALGRFTLGVGDRALDAPVVGADGARPGWWPVPRWR